jgi:L-asparaginase II
MNTADMNTAGMNTAGINTAGINTADINAAYAPLALVRRSGLPESTHYGVMAWQEADGTQSQLGRIDTPVFPRSALKPLQALAMLRLGLAAAGEELALTCSSHSGERFHLRAVARMLRDSGFTEDDLLNPPDLPYDERERQDWLSQGRLATKIAHNCSGKHTSMLRTCRHNGWSITDYTARAHPLQQAIERTLSELSGAAIADVGVDGCGAPAPMMTLAGLVRAYAQLAGPAGRSVANSPEAAIAAAMRNRSDLVGGTDRFGTLLAQRAAGILTKDGAEGVFVAALADGRTLAVKVSDGSHRPVPAIVLGALQRLGWISPEVAATIAADLQASAPGAPAMEFVGW